MRPHHTDVFVPLPSVPHAVEAWKSEPTTFNPIPSPCPFIPSTAHPSETPPDEMLCQTQLGSGRRPMATQTRLWPYMFLRTLM